jgi:multisubunit Na+/H+ antiporter MnhB subunit
MDYLPPLLLLLSLFLLLYGHNPPGGALLTLTIGLGAESLLL